MDMLGLQKAFHAVNHDSLLYKLKAIGFGTDSLLWVKPHLTDRVQSVDVGRTLSDAKGDKWFTGGTPQFWGHCLFMPSVPGSG